MVMKGVLVVTILSIQIVTSEKFVEQSGTQSRLVNYVKLMNAIRENFDDEIKRFEADIVAILTDSDNTIRRQIRDLVNHIKVHQDDIEDNQCIVNTLRTVEVLSVHKSLQLCGNKRNQLLIEDKIEKLENAGAFLDEAYSACNIQNNSSENVDASCVENVAKETTIKLHEVKAEIDSSLQIIRQDIKECAGKVITATRRSLEVAAEYFQKCSNIQKEHFLPNAS